MKKIKFGLIAGLIYAIADTIPMFFIDIPDRHLAVMSAFINRFAIGLLIFTADLKVSKWLTG
jgi:hypothetical protein